LIQEKNFKKIPIRSYLDFNECSSGNDIVSKDITSEFPYGNKLAREDLR
jgi:hypothetical protein